MTTLLPRPELYCPFPSTISPYRDQIETQNFHWLSRFGFLTSPEAEARVRRARFGWLAARAYPNASVEGLRIAAGWASWLFMRDDLCDEAGIGSDPRAIRALSDGLLAVLAGLNAPHEDDPLGQSLLDLRGRMIAKGGAPWFSRFLHSVQDYFEACTWEASNRERGEAPDLANYQRMRDLTGAVKTCFDINELADGDPLPIEARYHPTLARMMQLANRVICWSNDIFSVGKELYHDDCHNLVIVLHRTRGMSLEEAVLRAAQVHDAEVDVFLFLERQMQTKDRPVPEVMRFISALKTWMRANLDWSLETGRYAENRVRPDAIRVVVPAAVA